MASSRALLLAGVLGLALLAAIATMSAVDTDSRKAVALEGEMNGEQEAPVYTNDIVPGDDTQPMEEEAPSYTDEVVPEEPANYPIEDVPESEQTDPHASYAMLHPVYMRCAKKTDMHSFVELVVKSCGDIHELSSCSTPCAERMQAYSASVGCCWETVMDAYKTLDPEAHNAWRHWQGTLSGKCGITFSDENCGNVQGELGYSKLKEKVGELKRIVADNEEHINDLYYESYFNNDGPKGDDAQVEGERNFADGEAGSAGDEGGSASAGGNDNSGAAEAVPAWVNKQFALSEKHNLGDEVLDLPTDHGHDYGDVHVPHEALEPWQFSHKNQMKARMNQLAGNGWDDYRNTQNALRLGQAYKKLESAGGSDDEFFQWPGESWTAKAQPQQLVQRFPRLQLQSR